MQPTRRERNRGRRETEGPTVPPVLPFSFGGTYCCCSQLLPFCIFSPGQKSASVSFITVYLCCCFPPSLLTLSAVWLPLLSIYFLGFHPTVILFLFIPTSSHFHNSLHPPHQLLVQGCGQWGRVKRRIKDTCRRNGWEDRGSKRGGKRGGERWEDFPFASYSIEAAHLGLWRHTSEKGKHAEALEIREGEEDITSPKLQIKVKGFAQFPDFHLG